MYAMERFDPLVFRPLRDGHHILRECRRTKRWRPTVVALIITKHGFVVTRQLKIREREDGTIKRKIQNDIPKGGVDPHETLEVALRRELKEEVRLKNGAIRSMRFLGTRLVPFEKDSASRDGYSEGKCYFIFVVVLRRGAELVPGRDHRVLSVSARPDPWNHFGPKSQKRGVLRDPKLLAHVRRIAKL